MSTVEISDIKSEIAESGKKWEVFVTDILRIVYTEFLPNFKVYTESDFSTQNKEFNLSGFYSPPLEA